MAKKDESEKPKTSKPRTAPKKVDFNLEGDVGKSVIVVGDNAVVNYHAAVSANTKPNDPDYWNLKHPYPMPPNFTGRLDERAMLTQWLDGDSENRLFILRALGGFGKSALAWQWLTHDVNPEMLKKVVFWSFYEGDASFEHFVEETLKYLNREIPQGKRDQVDALLHAMQAGKILLIMDGFERALRAYSSMNAAYQGDEEPKLDDNQLDCVDINTETFLKSVCSLPKIQSKILMTTRLTPCAVKPRGEFMLGCREIELTAMQKADAAEFLHKQGIKGNRAEIESACEPYGYHPLSLRLLAGRILKDFQDPGDIAVAQKLKIDGDIITQKHHVLEITYNSLSLHEQKLLSTIACFRSPVEYQTLQAIAENKNSLDDDLHDLTARGVLNYDEKNKKFDVHPIVRRYAYERLTAPSRIAAHSRLRDYFVGVNVPAKPQSIDEITPVIELYHHTLQAGFYGRAFNLYNERLRGSLYYRFAAYDLDLQLLLAIPRLDNGIPNLPSLRDQTWNLYYAALCCERLGRLQFGLHLIQKVIDLNKGAKNKLDLGAAIGTFAIISCELGNLRSAAEAIVESVSIFDGFDDVNWRGISHRGCGRIMSICGDFERAEKEFSVAESIYNPKDRFKQGLSLLSIYKGQLRLMQMKSEEALDCAEEARDLSGQNYLRENISANLLSGISLIDKFSKERIINEQLQMKIEYLLVTTLAKCRQINLVEMEPDILLASARWMFICRKAQSALESAKDALTIACRCGYRLKQADILNFLAHYALEQEKDKAKAKVYAEEAKKLATCDGPPYYYKVAYEEAEAMLERLDAQSRL